MIITIDGPASAGKGTLAQKLAQKYQMAYFDTGMVYRAVGLELVLAGLSVEDAAAAAVAAQKMTFQKMMKLSAHPDFRSDVGGSAASKVAAMPKVREALLKMQQDFARHPVFADGQPAKGAIYDGRDTGTVVCPRADLKLFVTASPEVRADRRHKEFLAKGMQVSLAEVLAQIRERDWRDEHRAAAPLKPAADARILDTTMLTADEVFAQVCKIVDDIQKKA